VFQQETGRCAQVSAVLDGLCKRPFKDFVKFCAVLISVEQIDIVVDLLSPEVQAVSSSSSSSSSSVKTTDTDAVPAVATSEVHVQPGFDWRAVMRRNLPVLTEKLDPDNGLYDMLWSRGVITDWNIDVFKVRIVLCTSCIYTVEVRHHVFAINSSNIDQFLKIFNHVLTRLRK